MYHPGQKMAQLAKIASNQKWKTLFLPYVSKSRITFFDFLPIKIATARNRETRANLVSEAGGMAAIKSNAGGPNIDRQVVGIGWRKTRKALR